MRKLSATEESLMEIQSKISKWNDFVRELPILPELAPAIATGRLELLRLAAPRALTAEECGKMFALVGGLLETNQVLQRHSQLLSQLAKQVSSGIDAAQAQATRLSAYANYQTPAEPYSEG